MFKILDKLQQWGLKQIFLIKENNLLVQNLNVMVLLYYNVKLMDNYYIMLYHLNIYKECIIKNSTK